MNNMQNIVRILKHDGIGILPTDTLYGVVGSAFSKKAVARLYRVRKRDTKKPCIILISSMHDLNRFGIKIDARLHLALNQLWSGPISIIFPCPHKRFSYLHRGTKTLAFRMPKPIWLRALLKKTGPLLAPSANIEGKKPARTIKEARAYFGSRVDFYVDRGTLSGKPSIILEIKR